MVNILWKVLFTAVFITALTLILLIIWDVPAMLGLPMTTEFAKLPLTLLTVFAMSTGISAAWSHQKVKAVKVSEEPVVPPLVDIPSEVEKPLK